ncbi:hypothetical protein B0A48_04745 [Cryoendolithus antarcticus]|uniref:Uncharacterized protein n=1 Tax=Cryoendolithus antarcticus TaxID=1507870 RepID=A0A1V8TD70_9PEZI|nr:hypothetical protein B0A48_04745 [Cryoendolithus antarcticus]
MYARDLRKSVEANTYADFARAFRTKLPAEIRNMTQFYVLPRFSRPQSVRTDIEVTAKSQKGMFYVLQDLSPTPAPTIIDLSLPYRHPTSLQVSRATRHAAADAYYADKVFSTPDVKTAFTFLSSLDPEHRAFIRHLRFASKVRITPYTIRTLENQAHMFVRLWYTLWFHNIQLEPNVLKMWVPREFLPSLPAEKIDGLWTAKHEVIYAAWHHPSMVDPRWSIIARRRGQLDGDLLLDHWTGSVGLDEWRYMEDLVEYVGSDVWQGEVTSEWEERFLGTEGEAIGMGIAWAEREGVRELAGDFLKEIAG